jgi:hypothetical protein
MIAGVSFRDGVDSTSADKKIRLIFLHPKWET